MLGILRTISCAFVLTWPLTFAQQPVQKPTTATEAPNSDTSYIDANGTAHITRVVSVPQDLSPEAQKFISQPRPDVASEESVAAARRYFEVGHQSRGRHGVSCVRIRSRRRHSLEFRSTW